VNQSIPFWLRLSLTLQDGLEGWPPQYLEPHRHFVLSQQQSDGGFCGRAQTSDLYYTSFALRTLAVMRALNVATGQRTAHYLQSRLSEATQPIDFFAWIISAALVQLCGCDVFAQAPADWRQRVAHLLERFRTPDGGYGKIPHAPHGSTYTTFLILLTAELLQISLPEPQRLVAFIQSRQRADGGFVEIHAQKRGSTNPTAAALAVLRQCGALDAVTAQRAADFLLAMVSPTEGGLRAHDRIPVADLLSTFTGIWSLDEIGESARIPWESIYSYALRCAHPEGGFRGGWWDDQADVEYTFYGVGVLALVGRHRPDLKHTVSN
jgi:geranylgeranyl transferase type-2 subunit beta